ncbi:PLP-dependent aminotransferase [Desulfocucumis palustris]|uniref:PLP-dependent aminotransferase n=1 Tax=Desulfocucumis palustris TaxID=1898651 RepID=A0A2L2X8S5_9FIRM|nr:aspartate aminotransferase family protein [Desulfocucumis palustris]GBF31983.1 PLP-dependent aminotransferase [Desulfocucumis palustris]
MQSETAHDIAIDFQSHLLSLDKAIEMSREEIRQNHKNHVNPELTSMMGFLSFDKKFVRARDTLVWDSDGNQYLDFLGAYGAMNVGHNHPEVLAALDRVREMPNLIQASLGTLAGALAHNLALITPGALTRSFFCNSGAEAVEGALKLARAATGRTGFIYCEGSFHGKSFGALSVTGREKYQKPFRPLLEGCHAVPYGDIEALQAALLNSRAAAFIVEPIQGEGGIIVPPPGYLAEAARLCGEKGTLLIADEIQTGMGRTGDMFACQYEQLEPDILCLAKSLGGGIMPAGAFITTDDIWQKAYGSWEKSTLHTSTFGGNTWSCAAGIATISVIYRGNLAEQAREKGLYFMNGLNQLKEKYPLLQDVRGRGLMVGIEFNQPGGMLTKATFGLASKLSQEYLGSLVAGELLNKYGIITAYTLNNPNVIRLEPPLTVTREQLDRVVEALDQILARHKGLVSMAASSAKTFVKSLVK